MGVTPPNLKLSLSMALFYIGTQLASYMVSQVSAATIVQSIISEHTNMAPQIKLYHICDFLVIYS